MQSLILYLEKLHHLLLTFFQQEVQHQTVEILCFLIGAVAPLGVHMEPCAGDSRCHLPGGLSAQGQILFAADDQGGRINQCQLFIYFLPSSCSLGARKQNLRLASWALFPEGLHEIFIKLFIKFFFFIKLP